jgi:hypothetical protein
MKKPQNLEKVEAIFNELDEKATTRGYNIRLKETNDPILEVTYRQHYYPDNKPGGPLFYPEPDPDKYNAMIETTERTEMELDLSSVEIPVEFIDERIKFATKKKQVGYLPEVKLVGIGATGIYEVIEDYLYSLDYFSIGRTLDYETKKQYESQTVKNQIPHLCTITVPKGFQFDRASIPRLFWIFISKDDLSNVPPMFHDLLYRFGGVLPDSYVSPYTTFSRLETDYLFKHLMERCGVKPWRLFCAYQAVRNFATFAWGGNK